jgi:hypothetical protein
MHARTRGALLCWRPPYSSTRTSTTQSLYSDFLQCRLFTHYIEAMVTDLGASPGPLSTDGSTDFGCRPAPVIPPNDPAGLCPPPPSYTVLILIMVAVLVGILAPCCACAYCCYRRYRSKRPAPVDAPPQVDSATERPPPAGEPPDHAGLRLPVVADMVGTGALTVEPWVPSAPPLLQEARAGLHQGLGDPPSAHLQHGAPPISPAQVWP